jgi:cell division protein FtsI/penicillin-binding protein 2
VNSVASNFYEPGSTFKVLTVMAALEEGVCRDGQIITDCRGSMAIGNRTISEHGHEAHGPVDCGRLLEQSCNVGAAVLALKLGPERFQAWCEKAGFGRKTGIELANESPGSLNKKNIHARITLANQGFGQSIAVTPLQMIALYGAVANGGEWIQPHLIKSIQAPDGITWKDTPPAPSCQICSAGTAALLRGYLERVVLYGTGKKGQIESYRAGGKTGTAQKAGVHGYAAGKYVGSFIGIVPIDAPRLAIIVLIDEPTTTHYGADVAAPAFGAIARRSLQYLNVPPSAPLSPEEIAKSQKGHHLAH